MTMTIENSSNNVVLKMMCREPEGSILRKVSLASLSFERIQFLWNKMQGLDILFNDFVAGDFEKFLQHFIVESETGDIQAAGLIWDVDDIGIFIMNSIIPEQSAQIHYVFWDKRFRGREDLCREMMKYAMDKYNIHRLWTEIPLIANSSLQAADRIGLIREGRKRKAIMYKGVWVDTNMYGILREDLEQKVERNRDQGNPPVKTVCWSCGEIYEKHHTPRPRSVV